MKKTTKETLEWHPAEIKYPENLKTVLVQTNDGIFRAYWDKQNQKWCMMYHGQKLNLNSDTHVEYWTYWPKGVNS